MVISCVSNNISGFLVTHLVSITSQDGRQFVGQRSFVFINISGATFIFHVEGSLEVRKNSGRMTVSNARVVDDKKSPDEAR